MAARSVVLRQLRTLCRNVYILRRHCDSSSLNLLGCRSASSNTALTGTLPLKDINTTSQHQFPGLSYAATSRGFATDPSRQAQEAEHETPSPDHPLPNIEDPFKEPVEPCILCKKKVPLSYKNVQLLSQFISPNTGRLYGRHITKLCGYQQKQVGKAVKRARQMGFMPFMYRETIFLKDPNLFDIRYSGNVDIAMQEPSNLIQPEMEEEEEEHPDKS